MFDLAGKRALVTGASGGIGGAIAAALHAQGATVTLSGTRQDALEAMASRLGERVYVAAADHAPPVGVGNSMVLDPMGVELVTIGESTDVAVAWVSAERIAAVRAINPSLALRRFGVVPRGDLP